MLTSAYTILEEDGVADFRRGDGGRRQPFASRSSLWFSGQF